MWSEVFWALGLACLQPAGVSISKSSSANQTRPDLTTAWFEEKWLLFSEAFWPRPWPRCVNGDVWVLRVNQTATSIKESIIKRSLPCGAASWEPLKTLTGRKPFGGYFGLTGWGCPALPPPLGWENLCLWHNRRMRRSGSDSSRYEASSCPFSSRALLSYPELVFLEALLHVQQWFSTGESFDPQGTFVSTWRCFWWSQLENATSIWWIESRDTATHSI